MCLTNISFIIIKVRLKFVVNNSDINMNQTFNTIENCIRYIKTAKQTIFISFWQLNV